MYTVRPEEHRPLETRGYHFVPAAMEYYTHGGLAAYVRYKRYQDKPILIRHRSANRLLVECPDRDILLLKDQHHEWPYKPTPGVWDEYVPFSVFPSGSPVDADVGFFMLNYTDYINSKTSPMLRNGRARLPHEPYVISDSGGFQLMMGRLEWIDPLEAVKWYNKNVDLAMVLDIPTGGVWDKKDFLTVAKAQAHNTDIMMRNKVDSLELINIFHGHDMEWIREFRAVVERPDVDRLAVGGAYFGTLMATLSNVFSVICETSSYKHHHVLGVWNLLQLIPIMRFASKGIVPLVTSDASTAVQNANAKQYAYFPAIDEKWQLRKIGLGSPTTHANHNLTLPCHCPVCSTLKYTDVLSVLPGGLVTHTLVFHNVYQMNNYIKSMYPLIAELSVKEITDLMMAQLGNRRGVHEARWGLQFADAIAAHGLESARKRLSAYVPVRDDLTYDGLDSGLFDSEVMVEAGVESAPPHYVVELARRYLSNDPKDKGVHGKEVAVSPPKKVNVAKAAKRQNGSKAAPKKSKKAKDKASE